jgi:hypothetical protein
MLLSTIDSDSSWAWANNESMLKDVRGAITLLDKAVNGSKFARDYVFNDERELRKEFADSHQWDAELLNLCSIMQDLVVGLQSEVSSLLDQHKARLKHKSA